MDPSKCSFMGVGRGLERFSMIHVICFSCTRGSGKVSSHTSQKNAFRKKHLS